MSTPPRIVSLLPSSTEIACALGLRDALVGRSHECDHPADVAALPALTEAKLDASAPGAEIDARVRQLVRDGLSVYRVDAELLRELAPDLILTQQHCEVCAASSADVEAALHEWVGARPTVLSLEPATLADVWGDLLRVGEATGCEREARTLFAALTERVSELGERCAALDARPSVATLEWLDPLMAAGNWMPEMIALAGGHSLFGTNGAHSPWLEAEALYASDPDVVVALPCGFDLARTQHEIRDLAARPEFRSLRAVRSGRAYCADGHQYFNRPGPRLVDSLEILCEMLHPEAFPPAHRGRAWEGLSGGGI